MWVSTGCSPCPPLGCTRRRAPRISAYAYSAPADADRPRGMEASGAVSWPFSSVLLPLASFSGALCNVATNCDKLSEAAYRSGSRERAEDLRCHADTVLWRGVLHRGRRGEAPGDQSVDPDQQGLRRGDRLRRRHARSERTEAIAGGVRLL